MIIALAGHVDHGKTSLIRALTGVETDRLKQEVERGLTIDLGFAYTEIDGQHLGFVDVPGHHRFVHNMLAGISPHQCAMLVIAADDGVMPQTLEHLSIMQLLGLQRGLVVINKIDRVSADQLQNVTAQIKTALTDSFLAASPMLPVSATQGTGIPDLRRALVRFAAPQPDSQGCLTDGPSAQRSRLPIDRAFSYRGVGTIVTGTLHAGSLELEQEVTLFPSNQSSRIRSLRANDQTVARAGPGDRVAVNLASVEAREVERGMWLQSDASAGSSHQVITLSVLPDFPRSVRHWSRVHVYHGSSHRLAQLALLDRSSIAPGDTALAELICDEPLLTVRGDRLIVRDHGLDQTLGGGTLISNTPAAGRRRDHSRMAQLTAAQQDASVADAFMLATANNWLSLTEFVALWGITDVALTALQKGQKLVQADDCVTSHNFYEKTVAAAAARFDAAIDQHDGLLAQDFCGAAIEHSALSKKAQGAIQDHLIRTLSANKHIVLRSGRYYRPNSAPTLSEAEAALLTKIEPHLRREPPPSLGDIGKALNIPAEKMRRAVLPLAGKGALVLFGNNRLMLPDQFKTLAQLAITLEAQTGPFTVKDFRDASKLGRNLVIDVLEHMDAGGYTRRNDNTRSVVGDLARIIKQ